MSALTGPLNADRPGFSTSPQTVTRGHLQFEGGYQFTVDDEGQDVADHTLPLLLFRTGLLDNLELRLSWAGVSWTEVDDNTNRDINDMSIGFKVKVYDASGLVAMPVRLRPGMRC
jgi:hypothetical protein